MDRYYESRLDVDDPSVLFVDKTLAMYTPSKITKFSLKVPYCYKIKKSVESWISFASSREVEELCLDFGFAEYRKNGVLYSNCSARKITLTSLLIKYSHGFNVDWMALKVLSLVDTTVHDRAIGSILQGSPLVEVLVMRNCELVITAIYVSDEYVIDVNCSSLKELVIDSCAVYCSFYHTYGSIEITCSNLLSLSVVGRMFMENLKLVDVSSLVEATIDFFVDHRWPWKVKDLAVHNTIQKRILQELSHVSKFIVGTCSLQDVSLSRVEGDFFGKSRRKILEVTMKLNKSYFPGIAALISSSPDLEELTIKIIPTIDYDFEVIGLSGNDHFAKENYWRSEIGSEESLFQNLKIVDIVGFTPELASDLKKLMVELVQFLLANAKVLQKLIIHAEATDGHDKPWSSQLELLEISQKLLCFPTASPNVAVILKSKFVLKKRAYFYNVLRASSVGNQGDP